MDFAFFDRMSSAEGEAFLSAFLRAEGSAVAEFVESARRQGVSPDFSIETLPSVMEWAVGQVKTVPKEADETIPAWITATEDYKRGLFEFAEESKPLVLRAAYYFGECFVRTFDGLKWAVGDNATAQRNMPVIAGFGNGIELAPILVTENLFRRILTEDPSSDAVDRAIRRWRSFTV
ncbi:MAG TPA: hypothetical protein VF210_07250 [Pseudomonadales bacterium]